MTKHLVKKMGLRPLKKINHNWLNWVRQNGKPTFIIIKIKIKKAKL